MSQTLEKTALILIGFQNDYFAHDGILSTFLEDSDRRELVLSNTLRLVDAALARGAHVIATPICFSPDFGELIEPVGILAAIKQVGAFVSGRPGSELVPELRARGEQIQVVPGKRGLNAFSNTDLNRLLDEQGVTNVLVAGVVTSICVDSTARHAFELGYRVTVLSDCTMGRTSTEQDFYVDNVFPLYAGVTTHDAMIESFR